MSDEGLSVLAGEIVALRLEVLELQGALERIEALLKRVALSLGIRPEAGG